MHIGILQTGRAPDAMAAEHGEYPPMFEKLLAGHGFTFDTYPVLDMVLPGTIQAADGWLITGSRHGVYDDLPWIAPLEQFIRDCHGADVPMVGICFGHQVIASALGGRVEKFAGGWSVGHQTYDFGPLGQIAANAWHQDQVLDPPKGARTVGRSEFCAHAALVYGRHAFTVQPHPEYDGAFISGLIETRGPGVVPSDLLARAGRRLDAPTDNARVGDMIARFFQERRID